MKIQEITNNTPREIVLEKIEISEGPYTLSYGFDLTDLKKSILETGIINAPILVKNSSGKMDIVTGYRRIRALQSLGESKVFFIDLSDHCIQPLNLLLLNLYDNLTVRKLNPVEIGMMIKRLSVHISMENIRREYLPKLGITKNRDLDIYLRLEKSDKQLKDSVSKNEVSLKTADILLNMDTRSMKKVLELISNLKININYQLQLVEILEDLSERDNLLISEMLNIDEHRQIRDDKELNRPQRIKKLFQYLRSQRHPYLNQSEETFKKMIKELKLPSKVSINHSPFFEEQDYKMEILFKDGKELLNKLLLLMDIEGIKNINDPWIKGHK